MTAASCAGVHVKDAEWCADAGALGASCVTQLTATVRTLEKPEWDSERVGMLCTDYDNFKDQKAALEYLCHITGACTYDVQTKMARFFSRIEQVRE